MRMIVRNSISTTVANILSLGIQAIPPSIVPANVCTEAYYTRKKRQTIRQ